MSNNSIVLNVTNTSTFVEGRLESSFYKEFKKLLGYYPEGSFWMVQKSSSKDDHAWKKNWDGLISTVCWSKKYCRCNDKKDGMHFPTGLLSKAVDFFKSNGIQYNIYDKRFKTEKSSNYSMSDEFEYRDYQQEIINRIVGNEADGIKGTDRGIIKVCTGGGKTSIASGIISGLGVFPTVFYVPSIDLLEQAKKEIERFIRYRGEHIEVGTVGGGKKDIKDITVMTIQTAVRALGGVWVKFDDEDRGQDDSKIDDYKEEVRSLIKDARLMICDEVQHWAAETCQIISDNSPNSQYRFGMSATPWRDMGDDILIDACFGKQIANINASFLIKNNYLVRPTIHFAKISNMWGIGKSSYAEIYKRAVVQNEVRNSRILQLSEEFRRRGRKVLILVKQIAHGKLLESLIPDSIFLHGDSSQKKRLAHLDKMRTGEPHITIASTIFDEGIDCRPLDTLIQAGSGKSPTRALQRIGRILRPYPGKEYAIAVDFMDHCKYLKAHSDRRKNIYETEEEFDIKVAEHA